ncbi:MAG: hypothetical protein RXR16_03545 [Thermocladium sp.]
MSEQENKNDTIYPIISFFLNSLIFAAGIDVALMVLFPKIPQSNILIVALILAALLARILDHLQSLEEEIRELREKLEKEQKESPASS